MKETPTTPEAAVKHFENMTALHQEEQELGPPVSESPTGGETMDDETEVVFFKFGIGNTSKSAYSFGGYIHHKAGRNEV
jgi:hypothetical protein